MSARPVDPRWSCARKRRFESARAAEKAANRLERERMEPWNAYGCDHCGGWHIGHDRLRSRGR